MVTPTSHIANATVPYKAVRLLRGANATAARLGRGVVTVVPVTSNIDRVYPFQVLLPAKSTGLRTDSKAQAEQVRSVVVQRVGNQLGRISSTP